ncbi:MAG: hypothetical protein HQM10_14380 [Candidatus Riflebacteria bacterium]|nr:hypothetical protein [Candidatus Riflebacteria bacterium]
MKHFSDFLFSGKFQLSEICFYAVVLIIIFTLLQERIRQRYSQLFQFISEGNKRQLQGDFKCTELPRKCFDGTTSGIIRSLIFFAALIIPHRFMDNNSGYIQIQPGSPEALLLFALDVCRALAVLNIISMVLPVTSQSAENSKHHNQIFTFPSFFSKIWPVIFVLATAAIQFGVLKDIPHVQDEIIQDWQTRLFKTGALHSSPNSFPKSFRVDGVDSNGTWLYSTYQPAYSIVAYIFSFSFPAGLLNPILGLFSILIFRNILKRTYPEEFAGTATTIFSLSPFLLLMSSGRMNHSLALLLFLTGIFGIIRYFEGNFIKGALISSLSFSLMFMTRRIDGAIALIILFTLIPFLKISENSEIVSYSKIKQKIVFILISSFVFAVSFYVQLTLSKNISGDSLQMTHHGVKVFDEWKTISEGELFRNIVDNISGFSLYAFGGIFPGFIGFAMLKPGFSRKSEKIELFLLLYAILLITGYGLYYYQDFCYGPRYYFNLLPLAAIGITHFLRGKYRIFRLLFPAFAIFISVNALWGSLSNEFWHIDSSLKTFLENVEFKKPAGIIIQNPMRIRFILARELAARKVSYDNIEKISKESLDTIGLLEELNTDRDKSGSASVKILDKYLALAEIEKPEKFNINKYEIIRINSPVNPLAGNFFLALDLGDQPNEKLISANPERNYFLLSRRRNQYILTPYTKSGLNQFDQ